LAEGKYTAIVALNQTQAEQLESKDAELADLTPYAVLGLRTSGKSAGEISAKMNLEKSEVAKILEDADAGK
jgi:hypothetical protein